MRTKKIYVNMSTLPGAKLLLTKCPNGSPLAFSNDAPPSCLQTKQIQITATNLDWIWYFIMPMTVGYGGTQVLSAFTVTSQFLMLCKDVETDLQNCNMHRTLEWRSI